LPPPSPPLFPYTTLFRSPLMVPRSVVLDPVATLDTPPQLFLSSGMRAMDHAVERWLSIAPTPYADAVSSQAMGMLAHALPAIQRDRKSTRLNSSHVKISY